MMELKDKIELTQQNIWKALEDYGRHVEDEYDNTKVLDDVSRVFVERLARDSVAAKQDLREMLRKSPVWDEELDALVINGTRTHDPNYSLVYDLGYKIFGSTIRDSTREKARLLDDAIMFFATPPNSSDMYPTYIDAIKKLAPRAYAPNKKLSRVLKSLCDALGIWDDTAGSEFQHYYAQMADELSSKKINFKLFVSINPAHFITMSNPKHDKRGNTMTSCHSFNSTEYEYNCGCTGYARDKVTMIAFTASDPANSETLNNRKTSRQLYMYQPGNGLLLQSRMYNTSGGTTGNQAESKLYRDLIQREISACEGMPNLWRTKAYVDNDELELRAGRGFGGYQDWTYSEFAAKFSIRNDCESSYDTFRIGTYGLCIVCGDEISEGLYCSGCKEEDSNERECDDCEEYFDEDDLYTAFDRYGNERHVCRDCLENNYTRCHECDEWFDSDDMTSTGDDDWICDDCRERYYEQCEDCGEWYHRDRMNDAVDADGNEIRVCDYCVDNNYDSCDDCGTYVHRDNTTHATHHGEEVEICPACEMEHYHQCDSCGETYHCEELDENNLCENCREEEQEEEAV